MEQDTGTGQSVDQAEEGEGSTNRPAITGVSPSPGPGEIDEAPWIVWEFSPVNWFPTYFTRHTDAVRFYNSLDCTAYLCLIYNAK
jgi:hypothetical protein